jgi:hypothetical protein
MFEPCATFQDIRESGILLLELQEMYIVGNFIQSLDLFPGAGIVDELRIAGLIEPGFSATSNYDAYRFKESRLGQLARHLEDAYDEKAITRDKWIYRYRTNLLPRYYRKLLKRGQESVVASYMHREQMIVTELNEVNWRFFETVVDAAEQDTLKEIFEAERDKAYLSQEQLLADYKSLCQEVQVRLDWSLSSPGAPLGPKDLSKDLPEPIQEWITEALDALAISDSHNKESLVGGNLNYTVKIAGNRESFVFRCHRPHYVELVKRYLQELYHCAGLLENGGGFQFRSIREQAEFQQFLEAQGRPVPKVLAFTNDWMVYRFIEAKTLAERLAYGQAPVLVLRLLFQLFTAHERDIVYGDRWGANELVTESGAIYFIDFDIALTAGHKGIESLKNAEIAMALFGCLLHTSRRHDLLGCLQHYGISLLKKRNYDFEQIVRVLEGYSRFYLDSNKPTNQLSPDHETYAQIAPHLKRLTEMLEGET